jgi:hypothetical protein
MFEDFKSILNEGQGHQAHVWKNNHGKWLIKLKNVYGKEWISQQFKKSHRLICVTTTIRSWPRRFVLMWKWGRKMGLGRGREHTQKGTTKVDERSRLW